MSACGNEREVVTSHYFDENLRSVLLINWYHLHFLPTDSPVVHTAASSLLVPIKVAVR